jgi:hypothetical protein
MTSSGARDERHLKSPHMQLENAERYTKYTINQYALDTTMN